MNTKGTISYPNELEQLATALTALCHKPCRVCPADLIFMQRPGCPCPIEDIPFLDVTEVDWLAPLIYSYRKKMKEVEGNVE